MAILSPRRKAPGSFPTSTIKFMAYMAPCKEKYYVSSCNLRCPLSSLYGNSQTYRVASRYSGPVGCFS